jgi:hypothetical protein
MTEHDWLVSADPAAMLGFVLGRSLPPSNRKLWLFVVAVESLWWTPKAKRNVRLLRIAEAVAEGKLPPSQMPQGMFSYFLPGDAASTALECVRIHDARGDAPRWAALLRCLFGNPFRPVLDRGEIADFGTRAWCEARDVAEAIYADRDFGALPQLADALEEAGCESAEVLAHLRGLRLCPGCSAGEGDRRYYGGGGGWCAYCDRSGAALSWVPDPHVIHARGCWALDLILGKG